MASNYSNKTKTLKDMFSAFPSDIWTIDRLQKFCNYRNTSVICDCLILDDYREYFDQFLEEVDIDEKFYYSPAAFAEFYYGTPDLDFLVMYFAKITTLFEFNKPKIKVLSSNKLKDLNQLIVYYKKEIEESKENPTEYKVFNEITEARDVIRENYYTGQYDNQSNNEVLKTEIGLNLGKSAAVKLFKSEKSQTYAIQNSESSINKTASSATTKKNTNIINTTKQEVVKNNAIIQTTQSSPKNIMGGIILPKPIGRTITQKGNNRLNKIQ